MANLEKKFFTFKFLGFILYIKLENKKISFYTRRDLLHFQISSTKLLKLSLFLVCFLVLFVAISPQIARINFDEETVIEENDTTDKRAKNANEKFLETTEKKRLAVITAKEIQENDKEKFKFITYKVKKGDSLSSIATKHKVPIDSIVESSKLKSTDLKVGQKLTIPNKIGFVYRIKMGDTLANIVHRHKVNLEQVIHENDLDDIDILRIGKSVYLPGATRPIQPDSWLIPTTSNIVTSGYGWRKYPRHKFHEGLDFRSYYAPVRASKSGKVIYSGWLGGYGNTIVIDHGNSMKTLYAHNSRLYVKRGSYVQRGKVISKSGCTGFCFGPHVHFEVIKNGKSVNPLKYIKNVRFKKR